MRGRTWIKRKFNVALRPVPPQRLIHAAAHRGLIPTRMLDMIQPHGTHTVGTPAGRRFFYVSTPDDAMARYVVWPTGWESLSLAVFSQLARQSEHVLDVGAYSGVYSLVAGTDSRCTVSAVEPNPRIRANLARNLAANGLVDRVEVIPAAVSECAGTASLSVPAHDPTSACLGSQSQLADATTVRVDVTTIDRIARGRNVGVIKLDVEGHEHEVLMGASNTLEGSRPHLIVELLTDEAFNRVHALLRSWNYTSAFHIGNERLTQVQAWSYEPFASNFLFVSPDRASDLAVPGI